MYVCMYVCMYICMYVYIYICIYIYVCIMYYVCIYVCIMCVCMYVCMYLLFEREALKTKKSCRCTLGPRSINGRYSEIIVQEDCVIITLVYAFAEFRPRISPMLVSNTDSYWFICLSYVLLKQFSMQL